MNTREIPFYIELNKLTIDELINLKKADNDNNIGGIRLDVIVSMYMQVPKITENYWPKFSKDMQKIGIDPNKGDWFI